MTIKRDKPTRNLKDKPKAPAKPRNLKDMELGRAIVRARPWWEHAGTAPASEDSEWEGADDDKLAAALSSHVDGLRKKELAHYRTETLRRMRLYAGGLNINGTSQQNSGRVRFNLIKSIVDTGGAILGAARTLPFYQTRGADWRLRRKAMRRNQVLQQQFQDVGTFTEALKALNDAHVTGLGAVKYFEDPTKPGGAAACERLLPLSLVWDPTEAIYGEPPVITHNALWSRDDLAGTYPEHAEAIMGSGGPSQNDMTDFQLTRDNKANQAVVYETWKLPSSSESDDGIHVICTDKVILLKEQWKRRRYPIAFIRGWAPNQLGFVGVSLVEQCEEAQLRIEEISDYVRECQILGSKPHGWIPKGSQVEPAEIDNIPMKLNYYDGSTGQKPEFYTFSATPPDLVNQYQAIREETLSQIGMSTQQTEGEKPAGVTSAVGQRAAEDISSKRHVVNLRYIEKFYTDCAQCLVDVNDDIAAHIPGFAIDRSVRNYWLESSKWSEIALKEGEAKMAVLPVSALVGSVTAQFETMQSWVQAGWVDQQIAKMLAGHPDTEGQTEDDTEDQQYAHWLCDRILDDETVEIDPHADLSTVNTTLRTEYLRAVRMKADDTVLGEFRRIMGVGKAMVPPPPAAPLQPPQVGPQLGGLNPLQQAA